MYSFGIFIDLRKAFAMAHHSILLQKLNDYGIHGTVNKWFASYLVGQQQTTQIVIKIHPLRT